MIKVSYIKSGERRYNIERCLALIKTEITKGLKEAKRVVIKPNCCVNNSSLAITKAEALDALLNFVMPHVKKQVIVAEGTLNGDTMETFKNLGYLKLQAMYDFALVDLNQDETTNIELLNRSGQKELIPIAQTLAQSDYIISIGPPKTDMNFVFSGTIKNATIGSLVKQTDFYQRFSLGKIGKALHLPPNFRVPIDTDSPFLHQNLKTLFEKLQIKLAVIDGFEAMQGDGPVNGELASTHFAIASTNPIAADGLACNCLDINMSDIEYLDSLPLDKNSVFIVGDDWGKYITTVKKPSNFDKIRQKK